MGNNKRQILVCGCKGKRGESLNDDGLLSLLNENNLPFIEVDDLCGLAALQKQSLRNLFTEEIETLVIACNERSVKLLLDFAGVSGTNCDVRVMSRFHMDAPQIAAAAVDFAMGGDLTAGAAGVIRSKEGWNSWYPLVDYQRCSACGQCADFCLFGVYEKSGEGVRVVNPEGCKDLCPACARICPRAAIVFPKFADGGAIGGEGEIDERAESERIKNDLEVIAGNDIYHTLQQRKAKRAALLRESVLKRAEQERDRAIAEGRTKSE